VLGNANKNAIKGEKKMKRKTAMLLALVMTASLYGCGSSEAENQGAVETSTAAVSEEVAETATEATTETEESSSDASAEAGSSEEAGEAGADLSALEGTYIELFPEFAKEEYKDWWVECINAYETDEATVESYYKMLTESYVGTLKGQEAVDTYTAESFLFDCYFENDIATITIDGNTISGADADGNEIFSHEYTYVEDVDAAYGEAVMPGYFHVYKTDDVDAGDYTYFAFTDDTPAGEYHIEFRYGADLEGMGSFVDGDYAYWMASGILQDYDEEMIHDCIKLFVDENVGGEE
jgi:hypothetical protein